MKKNLFKAITLLFVASTPLLTFADDTMTADELKDLSKMPDSLPIHSNVIQITYLKKVKLVPENNWIGERVFKESGVCYQISQQLKNKTVKKPFGDLYNSAILPEELNLGVIKREVNIVNCENYETGEIVVE